MANLKTIRVRLSSVRSTRQITSAMKMVAAAKLRRAQDAIVQLRPYADKLNEIEEELMRALRDMEIENPWAEREKGRGRVLLVVVTSNKGLCGAFNANVIRETRRIMAENYEEAAGRGDLSLLTIGKKGYDTFRKMSCNILSDESEIYGDLSFDQVAILADRLMQLYITGEYDIIEIVYNQFRNAAVQNLTTERFLPVVTAAAGEGDSEAPSDFIYEPDRVSIITELIPKTLRTRLYRALLDSFAAEHGARMTAMHQATDNATELIRDLTLQYNKARQASITNQLLEVVSGAEALNA